MTTAVAKCKGGCRAGCDRVLITELDDEAHGIEILEAAVKVRKNFGCLFMFTGKGGQECTMYMDGLSNVPDDTVREREFECDGCSAHCRLAFNDDYAPAFACPRGNKDHCSHWWKEIVC